MAIDRAVRSKRQARQAQIAGEPVAAIAQRDEPQRSIQSVEHGFRLIRCLEEAAEPLTLKDLSARADMASSRAHLYLVSFRRVGLVLQEETSGRYMLGPYALQLGLAALRKLDVAQLSRGCLEDLSGRTGEASYLAVWGNRGPYIVLRADGPRPAPVSLQIGYVLPTLSTATGRIFISYLPRQVTEPVLAGEDGAQAFENGEASLVAERSLATIIAETRARKLSRTDGLLNMGFTGLSAPVFGHDRKLAAAVTLIGPTSGMDASLNGANAQMLRKAAEDLTSRMGGQSPD
ncbi:IclR family transcriptional regulator [Roseiarcaceae bacterium H3SJ34-1]|uniref:IclR family transcriptional regulator n=1 Tax=Terripilifer ovatus TaxID=3032367 RepID=UPI003AB9294E|nr:IclR family transcriptional regulator [Roseiarcaceae bacterium H3SJ34-1]